MSLFYRQKPSSEKFNFKRKTWHLLGLLIPAIYYFSLFDPIYVSLYGPIPEGVEPTRTWGMNILFILAGFTMFLDIVRFISPGFHKFFQNSFGAIMKERESDRFNATGPFLLANGIAMLLFPREIAVMTSFFLLIGDPFAAYFGGIYGDLRLMNGKSFIGSFAALLGNLTIGAIFFSLHIHARGDVAMAVKDWETGFWILISGSLSAITIEFFTGNVLKGLIDDNLTIPVVSGSVMMLVAGLW